MTSNPLVGDNPVDVTVEEGEGSRTLQRKSTATFEVNHPYKDTINCKTPATKTTDLVMKSNSFVFDATNRPNLKLDLKSHDMK